MISRVTFRIFAYCLPIFSLVKKFYHTLSFKTIIYIELKSRLVPFRFFISFDFIFHNLGPRATFNLRFLLIENNQNVKLIFSKSYLEPCQTSIMGWNIFFAKVVNGYTHLLFSKSLHRTCLTMMMNCFCGIVDRRKAFSLISSRSYYQRSSPSRISDTPRAGFEPAHNLSSGFVEWSCAVMITTTPRRHKHAPTYAYLYIHAFKKKLTEFWKMWTVLGRFWKIYIYIF